MAYATYSDVEARNPYRAINGSSKPSSTQVSAWITQAEAELNGTLGGIGVGTPVTGDGAEACKLHVVDYVSGLVKQAYAAAGGDGGNDDGESERDAWREWIRDIVSNSSHWAAVFGAGSADGGSARLRSHVTHNQDSLSKTAGDFAPRFAKASPEDQF